MRMPISGIYKIKGVGDVLAGRVEQGVVKPGEEVVFLPTHTASNPCTGKVFTVEMHHTRVDFANPGDNVGLNIKGLDKNNMPRGGDVMVYKKDTTLGETKEFNAQIQVPDIPNEIKTGYSPIGFVRCGRSACRVSKICWKMGKETGGKKNGGSPFVEIQRDGRVQLSAATTTGVRYLQKLRGPLPCCVHGWQRCRHAWQDCFLRAEERWCRRRQEKVSVSFIEHPYFYQIVAKACWQSGE